MTSTLYIVSTPIGNLEDITLRALNVFKEVDLIACEDTRTSKKLLTHYQIQKPLTSYHEHNEVEKANELLCLLQEGKSVALITDAGTPCVSDPGFRIVKLAAGNGIKVVPIPGASAAIAALSVSGLPTSRFTFLGFPPKQNKKLNEFLERIKDRPETLIFYESPKRVVNTLEKMMEILGNRNISVSREITKMYEETLRGSFSDILGDLNSRDAIKGEFVILVEGCPVDNDKYDSQTLDKILMQLKKEGHSLKDSVKEVTAESGISKSKVYKKALKIWE